MDADLRKIIVFGLCTHQVGVDRDDIFGQIAERLPSEPCLEPCDYCKRKAEYIAGLIEEGRHDK